MIHEQRIMHEIIFLRMFNQHQYFKLPRIIRNVYNFPHYKSGKMFYKIPKIQDWIQDWIQNFWVWINPKFIFNASHILHVLGEH